MLSFTFPGEVMHHYPALLDFEGAGIPVVFSEDKQPFDKVCTWFMC